MGDGYSGDGSRSCSVGSCTGSGAGAFDIDKLGVCVYDELDSPLGCETDRHSLRCATELLEPVSVSSTAKRPALDD